MLSAYNWPFVPPQPCSAFLSTGSGPSHNARLLSSWLLNLLVPSLHTNAHSTETISPMTKLLFFADSMCRFSWLNNEKDNSATTRT